MSDEKDSIHLEVSRRNGKAVEQVLREMAKKIEEQQQRIDGLNSAYTTMQQRLQFLETHLAMQRAKAMGSGPTA